MLLAIRLLDSNREFRADSPKDMEVREMNIDFIADDCWLEGQLTGIRLLERELSEAFQSPQSHRREGLQQRVAQLNSWLNQVDHALAVRARSKQK